MNLQKQSQEIQNIRTLYEKRNKIKTIVIIVGFVSLLILALFFSTLGVTETSISEVCRAIFLALRGALYTQMDGASAQRKIIVLIRLPRMLMAIVSGIGLSISGVAMQAITRNPLVSPFTIGLSSASAFGASLAIVFGISFFPGTEIGIVISAFLTSLICAWVVYLISTRAGMRAESIVLTGIALSYVFSALTSGIEFFAAEHKLASVVRWTFGTLNGATWSKAMIILAFSIICSAIIWRYSLMLNIISSGNDELVISLGIHPKKLRIIIGLLSVLMTSAVISFTGVIGFIGLVAPHIARMLIGADHRFLIPFSGIVGAGLLIISDTVGRLILSPVSIPVGIVVSIIGVPLFIHLILSRRKES